MAKLKDWIIPLLVLCHMHYDYSWLNNGWLSFLLEIHVSALILLKAGFTLDIGQFGRVLILLGSLLNHRLLFYCFLCERLTNWKNLRLTQASTKNFHIFASPSFNSQASNSVPNFLFLSMVWFSYKAFIFFLQKCKLVAF